MGANSHNPTIDESAKSWSKKVTHDQYEIAVGLRCDQCLRLYTERSKRICKQKEKHVRTK